VGIANPCCAHRGASGLAPENTMAAMKRALAFPFVEWIELDVQLSKDGVPVVIHDDTVDRTTDRKGRVADFTAAELQAMDAGSRFSPAFRGEPVPTLEQVLELTAGECRLDIGTEAYAGGPAPHPPPFRPPESARRKSSARCSACPCPP